MGMVFPHLGGIIVRPGQRQDTVIITDTDHVDDYIANKFQQGENVKIEILGEQYKFLRISANVPPVGYVGNTTTIVNDVYLTPDVASVFVDASQAHISLALPDAAASNGHWLALVGVDVSFGIDVIGQLYPGSHVEFNVNGESIILASDGTNWHVISKYIPNFYY